MSLRRIAPLLTFAIVAGVSCTSLLETGELAPLAVTNVAAGSHTCAVDVAGSAWCWGGNFDGQLGLNHVTPALRPQRIQTATTFAQITAGLRHTCALDTNGAALCWGQNTSGQLGNGISSNDDRLVPTGVSTTLRFTQISAGSAHSCAVSTTGAGYCWGSGTGFALGESPAVTHASPFLVPGLPAIKEIRAGNNFTCALSTAGAAFCWGSNSFGQLGDGTTSSTGRAAATAVNGGHVFLKISVGYQHACGVTASAVLCWGENTDGQLGDGTTTSRLVPTPVSSTQSFTSVVAGEDHSCALTSTGSAWCWGSNDFGALGDQSVADSPVPVQVVGGLSFASIAAWSHTCAVTTDARGFCWGRNSQGQVGTGSTESRTVPTRIDKQ
jgi:alpha-tubulin suppressor-like RCC1 family protein